jgi:hypothetical protein
MLVNFQIVISVWHTLRGGTRLHSWLMHYGKSRKVAGSIPDEADFSIYLILQASL